MSSLDGYAVEIDIVKSVLRDGFVHLWAHQSMVAKRICWCDRTR